MSKITCALFAALFFAAFAFTACGFSDEEEGNSGQRQASSDNSSGRSPSSGSASRSSSSAEISFIQGCGILPDSLSSDKSKYFCCFGEPYLKDSDFFCSDDELYTRCGRSYEDYGDEPYNPFDSICYDKTNGNLKPLCSKDGITGPCVHSNGLLKCKQLGDGDKYVIDPLPGMTCEDGGAITGTVRDLRTSESYKIAQIGNQIWLAEDLKTVPAEEGSASACYDGNAANCSEYGRLYDWATAIDSLGCNSKNCPSNANIVRSGLCPPSYGIPKASDWNALISYAGGEAIAGGRLKSESGWNKNINGQTVYEIDGNGTDSYGFNAKPGGYHTDLIMPTGYKEQGFRAMWWIDAEKSEPEAYYTTIISSDTEIRTNFQAKSGYKASVRCLHYY